MRRPYLRGCSAAFVLWLSLSPVARSFIFALHMRLSRSCRVRGVRVGVALLALALTVGSSPSARAAAPIVAVFDIQTKGVTLTAEATDRITELLAALIVSNTRFSVIPRAQITSRLREQKLESYRKCYDQACQIEIGKELAAAKVISTKIIKVGDECLLSMTLFDLKTATAERGSTAQGPCGEKGLSAALLKAIRALDAPRSQPVAAATPPSAKIAIVKVTSKPSEASLSLDGLPRGKTPLNLALPVGKKYTFELSRAGRFRSEARALLLQDNTTLHIPLAITPAGRRWMMTPIEWFSFEMGGGGGRTGGGFAMSMRAVTLRWPSYFATVVDFNLVGGGMTAMAIGARGGFAWYWGPRGEHQLQAGLGLGYATFRIEGVDPFSSAPRDDNALYVSPSVSYLWQSASWYTFSGGLRTLIPVARDFSIDPYPFAIFLTVGAGISSSRSLD